MRPLLLFRSTPRPVQTLQLRFRSSLPRLQTLPPPLPPPPSPPRLRWQRLRPNFMQRIIQSQLQLKRHLRRLSVAASVLKKTLPQRQRLPQRLLLEDAQSKTMNRHVLLRSFGDAVDASTNMTFPVTTDQVTAVLLAVILVSRLGSCSSSVATLVMTGR